ncbi:hypothetical protein [Bowdeniella massiliensis]|uniref:hypothetical protein n=1 Tax=Bowdeniella massiliensis TaxID=2932264 RepID=UPI0020285E64|nr:hypothetical protein [Bowdeniella massiliensis]
MSEKPSRTERLTRLYGLVKDVAKPGNIALAVMLIVIAVVAVTGGWSKASQAVDKEDALPLIELGKELTAGPFTLVFSEARHVAECSGFAFDAEHGCIEARLTATNTADRLIEDTVFATHLLDSGMLTVTVDDEPLKTTVRYPQIYRVIDGLTQGAYQPGLPTDIVVTWQPVAPVTSEDVTLVVTGAEDGRSSLDGHQIFRLTDPIARIPVEPLAAGAP